MTYLKDLTTITGKQTKAQSTERRRWIQFAEGLSHHPEKTMILQFYQRWLEDEFPYPLKKPTHEKSIKEFMSKLQKMASSILSYKQLNHVMDVLQDQYLPKKTTFWQKFYVFRMMFR